MSFLGYAIFLLVVVGLNSAGWYFLFKRFERRMSARFDDLVNRSEETLKSFADVIEVLGVIINKTDTASADLAERTQNVKLDAERILTALEDADAKLDILQGLSLVIKQDRFLDHAAKVSASLKSGGKLDGKTLGDVEALIAELKLDNLSRY